MAVQHDRVRFGAAYYYEYAGPGQDPKPETLERDLDLMQAAAFSVIRVGESVWSTWEPDEGRFELDWLEPVLDGALARGIDVVIGTPTYALPMWLVRRYPEVAGEDRTGSPMGWGARQEADFTHPVFRFYADRILRKIVERYRDHPAVIGFQVDNEPGPHLLHNRGVFQRFVDHLRHTYGDVETLNREWGLVYWSHRLSTWADLWTPDGNIQPQYDFAWRRVPGDADHGDDRLAGPGGPRARARRPVHHHLHLLRAPGPRGRGPRLRPGRHQREPLLPHAGRARAPERTGRAAVLDDRAGPGRCSSRATRCSPAAASRSW